MTTARLRIAVDIGGTFTDVVLQDGDRRLTRKVLTTPAQPEIGMLEGMELVLTEAGYGFSDVAVFVHGTTLATNAIIERRGAKTALITTEGFRDVLEIGTESRYDQYDLFLKKPAPLVPRARRFTVAERLDAEGEVRIPLDEAGLLALVPRLRELEAESVAIAFLHAYRNPAHEERAAALLKAEMPDVQITLASEVCPEIREYERTSTAVANAYVQPLMASYLGRMEEELGKRSFGGVTYLVTSGGGLTTVDAARRFPVRLVESGPAGGAIFAAQFARRLDEPKMLSFDMGGTTAKICLIDGGEPTSSRVFEVDRAARFLKGSGLPLRIPVIEMVEIGAGGGSIAQVDVLQRVTVGPESASSVPGPVCYGRGGTKPAVTDADVVLGLIDPRSFAGGRMPLDASAAASALEAEIGTKLGFTDKQAADAVHEIVCENMASAARVHAVERGAIIGQHALIAFGGAAPLHAARVAEKIGAPRVIVPPNAGVGSAVGFLAAPIAFEVVRSRHAWIDQMDTAAINGLLDSMTREARELVSAGAMGAVLRERRVAYMRYYGQGHEIAVVLPERPLDASDGPLLRQAYEREYEALFNRVIPEAAIEVMTWSVLVMSEPETPPTIARPGKRGVPEPDGVRDVFDRRLGATVEVPVYTRDKLQPGASFPGPAIITEDETSTVVTASFDVLIDEGHCIVMSRKQNEVRA
jgi:N-methylhydantoinase A